MDELKNRHLLDWDVFHINGVMLYIGDFNGQGRRAL
jgi:hypothetical protein